MDLSSGGQLPLHLAAAAGSMEVLQLLLAAGADVEANNGTGETALQVRMCNKVAYGAAGRSNPAVAFGAPD
jgi:ankyrin repeat protein